MPKAFFTNAFKTKNVRINLNIRNLNTRKLILNFDLMSLSKKNKQIPFKEYSTPQKLLVKAINEKGQGIAYLDEYEIYLEGVVPKDEVEVIVKPPFANGSKRRPATIVRFLSYSPLRGDNPLDIKNSSVYAYGNLAYDKTLVFKKDNIQKALAKANIKKTVVEDVVAADLKAVCRSKSIRYFAKQNQKIINGFYKPLSHEVEKVTFSSLEPQWFSEFANSLCELFTKLDLSVYDECLKQGFLRNLLLRDTKEGRLCVLTGTDKLPLQVEKSYKELCKEYKLDAIYYNLNPATGNQVLNGTLTCLSEKKQINLNLCGFNYLAGPNTFLQVNYPVATKLYQRAIEHCGTDKNGYALDLCCGVGTMTLPLSRNFKQVKGIEIVEASIEAAKINAQNNQVFNVSFEVNDVKTCLDKELLDNNLKAIICDPARVGIGNEACKSLCKVKSGVKLSYIFCSLTALSRDLKYLTEHGFRLDKVIGFDMFPFSSHVETLCLLTKE